MCPQSVFAENTQNTAGSHVITYLVELFYHVVIYCSTLIALKIMMVVTEILFNGSYIVEFMEIYSKAIILILFFIEMAIPIILPIVRLLRK
jgi:hypothetical protein